MRYGTKFPTWPTISLDDQTTFWFHGVIIVAVTDLENEIQRAEATSRARSEYEAGWGAGGTRSRTTYGLVMSPKHLLVLEFGRTSSLTRDIQPIFLDYTKIRSPWANHHRLYPRVSINIPTIETLTDIFQQSNRNAYTSGERSKLQDLPPELRKAVFDLLDRKSFFSAAKAIPSLMSEYWYHPPFDVTRRIASVAEEIRDFEPLRPLMLRCENETSYWRYVCAYTARPKSRYLLKFSGCDGGLAYYGFPEFELASENNPIPT